MSVPLVDVAHEVTTGIHRIQLNYPPIATVNVFALSDDDGLTLVDSGPIAVEYFDAVDEGLRGLGLGGLASVHTVCMTHAHTDHIGQAVRVQRVSGARCLVQPAGVEFANQRYGSEHESRLMDWYSGHGLPEGLHERIRASLPRVPELPEITEYGDDVIAGGHRWQVLDTGGHAPGHVALHSPDRRLVFVGDAVLEDIVPLIDVQPFRSAEILAEYFDGLRVLRELDVDIVLPGHGGPFPRLGERIDDLIARHEGRLDRIVAVCRDAPATAFALYLAAFGQRQRGLVRMRMALGQTIGYVLHLQHEGRLVAVQDGDVTRWQAP